MTWQKHLKVGLVVAAIMALGACRQEKTVQLPQDNDAPVTTDKTSYTPEHLNDHGEYVSYTISVSYKNTTAKSVYLAPCGVTPPPPDYQLEHYDAGKWTFNIRPTCRTGPGRNPIAAEIKPGEGFSGDLVIDAYTSRTPENYGYPLIGTDIEVGVNRVVLDLFASVDDEGVAVGELLPPLQRVSNAFVLETP